ncbi:TonB-dependent receptor [uncultured Cetobacterium sp.]|uniref:TonB-dependent receptor n=1 Tax=uncultured Cetobacterium sp. TaxID=527638 RepID=UPI0025EB1A10|nr:TonB-dependent receptor [uncultured Cetobacterium sp.]
MNRKIMVLSLLTYTTLAYSKLDERIIKLEESVITTDNFETNIKETGANITVITSEEIVEKGAQNLVDIVRMAPGVIVSHYYDSIRFDVRGAGSPVHAEKNTIVTLDGVPIKGDQITNIPIANIERVEVVPGGGGILYGDGAIGGIVNIRLKKIDSFSEGKNYSGHISGSVSSHESNKFGVGVNTKITEKIATSIGYNSSLQRSDKRGDEYGDIFSKRKNFVLSTKYNLNDGEIDFRYTRDEKKYAKDGDVPEDIYENDSRNPGNISRGESHSNDYYLGYRYDLNKKTQLYSYLGFYEKKFETHNPKTGTVIPKDDEEKFYGKIQLKHNYTESDYFMLGTDLTKEIATPQDKRIDDSTKDSYGIFLMNENKRGKFTFLQGVRYNTAEYNYYFRNRSPIPEEKWDTKNKTKYNDYSYTLETRYSYNESGVVYGKLSRDFRTPLISEMRYTVNAEKLNPQTQDTIEFGVKDYINDTYISLSTFYKMTRDEIYYSGEEYSNFPYYNIGDTERYGVEIFAEHYFEKLTLNTSITYIYHKIKDSKFDSLKDKEVPFIPNWKLGFGARYEFTPKIVGNADVIYYGRYFDSDDPTNIRKKDQGDYATVDISLSYKPLESLTLTGRVNNLFDEKYATYVGYWDDTRQYNRGDGRIYTLEATYKF